MIIKISDDWWATLDAHWPNLLECFSNCGAPLDDYSWSDGPGQGITIHEKKLLTCLEEAKRDRDHEQMHHFLQLCWMAAPDRSYIHSWPSWGTLCDLCSENWVFYPEVA